MSRWLFPHSTFTPIGKEAPSIPGLMFATFLGDGSLNRKDCTNLAPNGAAFVQGGAGPALSANYGTFSLGNCLITNMQDIANASTGAIAHTIVFVASPNPTNQFNSYMTFDATTATDTRIDSLAVSGQMVVRSGAGALMGGAGTCDCPFASNDQTTWNMFAWVSPVGKPGTVYNLTNGFIVSTPNPISSAARPAAGQWNIGALASTFANPGRLAFALGANTEMSQTDLAALHDAVRYPLQQRGIAI